jgi:hypothetical protein
MATKILRKTALIFGGSISGAGQTEIEQFGSKVATGTPNYTLDPAVIQALSAWGDGWAPALSPANNSEYKQDRNAVDFVASYQIAYILQMGIPEWDANTVYFKNSYATYNGALYVSRTDDNAGNAPPAISDSFWQVLYFPGSAPQPTVTVLAAGSGNYNPPPGCVRITVQMVGGGGGSSGAGGNTTFGAFSAGGGAAGPNGAGGAASGGTVNVGGSNGGAGGGSSFFGGAGNATTAAAANSGSGAGGGGAGAYVEGSVANPLATPYSVGGGGGGTYSGGSGMIVVREFYY